MTAACGSCKHWQPVEAITDAELDWYREDEDEPGDSWFEHWPLAENARWGSCGLIRLPGYGETTDRPAFVQDGSGYRADLYCRSDFGCLLHEADR